jgi:hypothetical protein
MARKKNISKKNLYSYYMKYYLEHNEAPKSVYQLAQLHNFDESQFYAHFGNLKALEKSIFKSFFDQTRALLDKSEEFIHFDAKNKLLSFYYTFFELLTANRSFVISMLDKDITDPSFLRTISSVKKGFINFVQSIELEKIDTKHEKTNRIFDKSVEESLWLQFLICIKFWVEDDSPSLEKTDMFIEKTTQAGFELLDVKPVKSIIDLGKFLFHEKISVN